MSATAVVVFSSTVWVSQAHRLPRRRGRLGRRRRPTGWPRRQPARRSRPTIVDGTVNFGRVPCEKGPGAFLITNMAMRIVKGPGSDELLPNRAARRRGAARAAAPARAVAGGGGGRVDRNRAVDAWMPCSAAVYDYLEKRVEVRPGRLLPAPAARLMATPSRWKHQQPEHKRIS